MLASTARCILKSHTSRAKWRKPINSGGNEGTMSLLCVNLQLSFTTLLKVFCQARLPTRGDPNVHDLNIRVQAKQASSVPPDPGINLLQQSSVCARCRGLLHPWQLRYPLQPPVIAPCPDRHRPSWANTSFALLACCPCHVEQQAAQRPRCVLPMRHGLELGASILDEEG